MGKWDEKLFRLDQDALKYYTPDGYNYLGEFSLELLENLSLDEPELSFFCQGRKSRLRGQGIKNWFSKMDAFINRQRTPESSWSPPPEVGTSKPNKSRLDDMYAEHKKKMEKLQAQRDREAEEETLRMRKEHGRNMSVTSSHNRRARITQNNVIDTAQRLFDEHKSMQQRLEQKRQDHEARELERIANNKMMNLPTRSASEPGLVTAREAGDRLHSDAERRELWRTQAKDAQAKDELTMVRVGVKSSGTHMTRCNDLHREATQRQEKLEKKRLKKEKEDQENIAKGAVACGDGKRAPNQTRLELLYKEGKERSDKFAKQHAEAKQREHKEISENQVAPKLNKGAVAARRPPPWKDPKYPFNLKKDEPPKEVEKAKAQMKTHADYGMVAIQAAIALRSGYTSFNIPPSVYKSLAAKLKSTIKIYKDALHHVQQDSGFAALKARSSQRLFQEHLLPEVEGWAHRLEPDPIRQVEDDLDALLSSAAKAQAILKQDVAPNMQWAVGGMQHKATGVPTALWALDPGVKTYESAETKALVMFGPSEGDARHRHLTDLSRLLLVFPSCDMLHNGLEQILKRFEVVDVRNHFGNPGRLGCRYVEVLVVVIVKDGREQVPHVCELRLELLQIYNATCRSARIMVEFYKELRRVYLQAHMDGDGLEKITRQVLDKPPEGHRLRKFRCHLGRRYGSTVCAWRKAFGGQRLLNFQRFREVCYGLHCGEHVTELWQGLDPNRGGCISLWELDPDAVSLLTKLRTRMLGALVHRTNEDPEAIDATTIFNRLTSFSRPVTEGCLEQHEFRLVSRPFGLTQQEADRAFTCLDHHPGSHHAPPAKIDVTDIKWLKSLISLVDTASVLCVVDRGHAGVIETPSPDNNTPVSVGNISYNSTPISGGPVNAWESPREQPRSQGSVYRGRSPSLKVDNKPASGRGNTALSQMGVDVSPNNELSENRAGALNDLGIDVEDDEDYDDEEEEGEEEEEEEDDEEPAEGHEETW